MTASPTAKSVTPAPTLDDDPGALGAELRGARVHAQRDQHIAEVHPGRGDRHPHLTGLQWRRRGLLHRQVLERSRVAGGQPPHRRRVGQLQQAVAGRPVSAGRCRPRRRAPPIAARHSRSPLRHRVSRRYRPAPRGPGARPGPNASGPIPRHRPGPRRPRPPGPPPRGSAPQGRRPPRPSARVAAHPGPRGSRCRRR